MHSKLNGSKFHGRRSVPRASDAPRVCFVAENQVGIGSAARALEPYARQFPNGVWRDITYWQSGGLIERLHLPGRTGGILRGLTQTAAALREGPFDALFFLTHNPAVLHQQAIGRTPTLLWTDVTPAQLDAQAEQYGHPVDKAWMTRSLKKALVCRTFHRAALCVGWSEWARRSLVNDYGVSESKTDVVPPGVDLTHWTPPDHSVRAGIPRLLFIGGDFYRKGGDRLLDVFRAHLKGRCVLDIVTRDPVLEEDGISVWRGLTAGSPALLSLYRTASALVLPTRGDCFSIASIEAMAMGLPVVISAMGGISEIVEHDRSGFLIAPNDGRSLRQALEALIADADLRYAMGQNGRARAESHFDAEKIAARLFSLLGRIATGTSVVSSQFGKRRWFMDAPD